MECTIYDSHHSYHRVCLCPCHSQLHWQLSRCRSLPVLLWHHSQSARTGSLLAAPHRCGSTAPRSCQPDQPHTWMWHSVHDRRTHSEASSTHYHLESLYKERAEQIKWTYKLAIIWIGYDLIHTHVVLSELHLYTQHKTHKKVPSMQHDTHVHTTKFRVATHRVVTAMFATSQMPADVFPLTATVYVVAGSRPPSVSLVSWYRAYYHWKRPWRLWGYVNCVV